jgi:predicted HTH transcriptional regulator
LRVPHPSIPRNPLLAEPLFLARYIEKAGTGTLEMINLCAQAGLPAPDFRQDGGQFVQTLWRDWLTDAVMDELGLNERQRKAVAFVKTNGRITNTEYQRVTGATRKTSTRDLADLVERHILQRVGALKATHYVIAKQ